MKHEQEKDATESESESDSQAKKLETLEALPKLPLCLPHYYIYGSKSLANQLAIVRSKLCLK